MIEYSMIDRFSLQFHGIVNLIEWDLLLSAMATINITDNLLLSLGAMFFEGENDTLYGSMTEEDNVHLITKFYF